MKNQIFTTFALLGFALTLGTVPASAEPVDQVINLKPGWNAVFLQVQPESNEPADVFAGLSDLISVWAWNPQLGTVEFIDNPNQVVDPGWEMMAYRPGEPLVTNLHAIFGNRAYLIQRADDAQPVSWSVHGEALPPEIDWKPNAFNFVGFHVDGSDPPPFETFFEPSSAHAGQDIYILDNAQSKWVSVDDATMPMARGEGFWVYCEGSSDFTGALAVQLEQGDGLHYGTLLSAQDIVLTNVSQSDLQFTPSLSNTDVPLYRWVPQSEDDAPPWQVITESSISIPAGESETLRIGVKRGGDQERDALEASQEYTANLRFKAAGVEIDIPVSVTGIDLSGLWVGEARITEVEAFAGQDSKGLQSTATDFAFRLILHAADDGQVQLLNEVIEVWCNGAEGEAGIPVLLAGPPNAATCAGNLGGIALRGGREVGRRISAPAFGAFYADDDTVYATPLSYRPMAGTFGEDALDAGIVLPEADPTNPFVHRYHPDHAPPNQDTPAEQRFKIKRTIRLSFSDRDSAGTALPESQSNAWGSTVVGGVYQERICNLQSQEAEAGQDPTDFGCDPPGSVPGGVRTQGTFLLHKVSDIGMLSAAQ